MIQRIQTVWLLVAIVLLVAFFFVPFGYSLLADESAGLMAFESFYVYIPVLISGLLSLIAIFLYRKLDLQKSVVIVAMVFALVAASAGLVSVLCADGASLGWGLLLPLLAAVAQIAAVRGVAADQRLLRSYDRLR